MPSLLLIVLGATSFTFAAMPSIVGEGRRVINNIQRAAALFLVKNIFSLGLSLLAVATGQAYPMLPLHMSIISGLTIGVPSFFLAMEPNYERVTGKHMRKLEIAFSSETKAIALNGMIDYVFNQYFSVE